MTITEKNLNSKFFIVKSPESPFANKAHCRLVGYHSTATVHCIAQRIRNSAGEEKCNQPPLKRFRLLAQDMSARSSSVAVTAANTVDNELIAYIAESKTYEQNTGLQFWIANKKKFPFLAPLAQDLLSAPASEAYVERVFSVCGDMTTGKRNRLTKGLEKRVFLKMNKKYYC